MVAAKLTTEKEQKVCRRFLLNSSFLRFYPFLKWLDENPLGTSTQPSFEAPIHWAVHEVGEAAEQKLLTAEAAASVAEKVLAE